MSGSQSIGSVILQKRSEMGLTQAELARRAGCATLTLRKIEEDQFQPSTQVAERLAMALDIPLEERSEFVKLARQSELHPNGPDPSPPTPPQADEIGVEDLTGKTVRGYRLGEKIGSGGFGAVYRADQPSVEREVAIKIFLPKFANHIDFIRRFEAEAQLVARLEHPHIVPLYDYWREPDRAYIVMRLFRGGSLKDMVDGEPLSLDFIFNVLANICPALHSAHRFGVIHRDLKPGNILLDEDRNAYLADFGIAKNFGNPELETQIGVMMGTPAYISPEQGQGSPVSPASDIYSLGILAFELLTGELPFGEDSSPIQQIIYHVSKKLPPVSERNPKLPAGLDPVIARATAKDPADRHPDVLSFLAEFQTATGSKRSIYTGISPTERIEKEKADLLEVENPYKGLMAFGEGDAQNFFGRDSLIQEMLGHLAEEQDLARFLSVVGPSGSGKSSVVHAGLIPALRKGALPGSQQWLVADFKPGAYPFEELAKVLNRVSSDASIQLLEILRSSEKGLIEAAESILPDDDAVELLLVVDQFEELFTHTADEEERAGLMALLVAAVLAPQSRVRVVITFRADFTDRPLQYPDFGELIRHRSIFVLPLSRDELNMAITRPAARVGLIIEPALTERVIEEIKGQPGTLPMLQFALTELFERRNGRLLTEAAYEESGGVFGSIGHRTEQIFSLLEPQQRDIAKQIFLRLVTVEEGAQVTRRRATIDELHSLMIGADGKSTRSVDEIINLFGKFRLLTFDREEDTRAPTVELAHEALLSRWSRYEGWVDASRADVKKQQDLSRQAREWQKAGKDASFLLQGTRLVDTELWAQETVINLTQAEEEFLETSIRLREQKQKAEAARLAREQQLERRSRRVLQILLVVLSLATAVSIYFTNFALDQQQQAEIAANSAAELASLAQSRELAAHALNQLHTDPELSILLAIQALEEVYTREAHSALIASLGVSRIERTIPGNGTPLHAFALDPDGKTFATVGEDPVVNIWDIETGELVQTLPGLLIGFSEVDYAYAGEYIAALGMDRKYYLWDISTGELIYESEAFRSRVPLSMDISPEGMHLAYVTNTGAIFVEDWMNDIYSTFLDESQISTNKVRYNPDGSLMATSEATGRVRIWSFNDTSIDVFLQTELPRVCDWADGLAWSPDGRILAVGCQDAIVLWDVRTSRTIDTLKDFGNVFAVAFNQLGNRLTSATSTGIRVWDVNTRKRLYELQGHRGNVNDVAFTQDNTRIISVGEDGTIKIWSTSAGIQRNFLAFSGTTPFGAPLIDAERSCWGMGFDEDDPCPSTAYSHIAVSPNGEWFATGTLGGIFELREFDSGDLIHSLEFIPSSINNSDISFDGRMVATAWGDNISRIYDPASGELLQALEGHRSTRSHPTLRDGIQDVAFNPDATLFASAGLDSNVIIWDPISGAQIRRLGDHLGPVTNVEFGPQGKLLASVSAEPLPKLIVWDTSTWEIHLLLELERSLYGLVFSLDGSKMATSGVDGSITVWDTADARPLLEIIGHAGDVVDIVFSPDGQSIATVSTNGELIVWDANSGIEIFSFRASDSGATGVAFHPDGQSLLVSTAVGRIILYRLDVGYYLDLAQSRVTRGLTDGECRAYLYLDKCVE